MISIRKSNDRGHADHGWLKAYHTFSFANYYDPQFMNWSVLRVINEDRISAGMGFATHGHNDMEIITYIVDGQLQHKDSMGNTAVISPGEVQYMSAGTGVRHSEFNPRHDQSTHLLQIWILPDKNGHAPRYGQTSFATLFAQGDFVLTASKDGREGSLAIHQDINMYVVKSPQAGQKKLSISKQRTVWVQNISGLIQVNQTQLNPGDGAGIALEEEIEFSWPAKSEFIVFDLPVSQ